MHLVRADIPCPLGLRWSDSNTIAGVNPHWIEIFNRADYDELSFLSRTTSISNSFQPSKDSSMSSSLVGDKSSPRPQISSNSSLL